jgi:hypothetical protein
MPRRKERWSGYETKAFAVFWFQKDVAKPNRPVAILRRDVPGVLRHFVVRCATVGRLISLGLVFPSFLKTFGEVVRAALD